MKKALCFAPLLLAFTLVGCSHPQPAYYAPPPPPALDYQAIEQQGSRAGFEAAKHDVEFRQPPGFEHHPRYRNPPVPSPGFESYRQGFRHGYEHFLHQAPPPPPA